MANEDNKKYHNELNPKIWKDKKLKPEVLNKLKNIANAFIEFLDIPASAIKDIVLTGSNVSYNYTPQSDLDVHLIVDFQKVHKNCPIVGDFLLSKKSEFNSNHDIFIYGIPVEVYAEPTDAPSVYNGLFSIKHNKWIQEPKKLRPLNNSAEIKAKYKEIKNTIEELTDESKFLKNEVANGELANKLMKKLKEMRKAGLHKEGEFSVENQVFKKLRNEGYIGKIYNIIKKGTDMKLSLEEKYEEIIDTLEETLGGLNTTTTAMAPYATQVIGHPSTYSYTKQTKNSESKPAMKKFKFKKNGKLNRKNKGVSDPISDSMIETMEKINNLCEEVLKSVRTKAALNSIIPREQALQQAKKEYNSIPGSSNSLKAGAKKRVEGLLARLNHAKKEAGFFPNEK